MRYNEMRKTGIEPAPVSRLDPKSRAKPLTKANTRPSRTDEHRKGRVTPIGLADPATKRFAGDVWCLL